MKLSNVISFKNSVKQYCLNIKLAGAGSDRRTASCFTTKQASRAVQASLGSYIRVHTTFCDLKWIARQIRLSLSPDQRLPFSGDPMSRQWLIEDV